LSNSFLISSNKDEIVELKILFLSPPTISFFVF
jgi:hypothetical protein